MTTLIVDDKSAACDSMWSDANDLRIQVPLNKYLFVPTLEPFENEQKEWIGAPKLLLYCGTYEQILLHQAFTLKILDENQYVIHSGNWSELGYSSFGYIEILLEDWTPAGYQGINSRQGVLFGGTGGNHAYSTYNDCYNTIIAVEEAIKLDPKSDIPISSYHHTLDGDDYFENLHATGNVIAQNVYSLASELIISLQTGELGGDMSRVRYSGCTTSASPEAPDIDVVMVVRSAKDSHYKIQKRKRNLRKIHYRSDMDVSAEKVEFKQIKIAS